MTKKIVPEKVISGSFRDPSGFLFTRNGVLYRQVNAIYKDNYDRLIDSGLYEALVKSELLIGHEEVEPAHAQSTAVYKVIKPQLVEFISYPFEWCFSQLRDAALATLKIQKIALEHGMSLKDCSAYNIQFKDGKPCLIDTLSFEIYQEGKPWVAYQQFCRHFLAPLALMSYTDVRLNQLSRVNIDGVHLDMASSLLPSRTRLSPSLLTHIHLHSKSQKYFGGKQVKTTRRMSRLALMGLVDNLEKVTRKMSWKPASTHWSNYYQSFNYDDQAFGHKKEIVNSFLDSISPPVETVWDLGANTGVFSRIAAAKGLRTLAFDLDPAAVENNYLACVKEDEKNILPLLLDLTNPSPALGWANSERMSLTQRGPADAALALALIHHLAISNNVPLNRLAEFLADICRALIIEFVPKSDPQVQRLLFSREDIFADYHKEAFEREFGKFFEIQSRVIIANSKRTLYLMRKIDG